MDIKIADHFAGHALVLDAVAKSLSGLIEVFSKVLTESFEKGNKVLIMGNGGSAADAQHFAAELIGRFLMERRALPAVALSTDTSILTAVGNDYGFDEVFRRQVEALVCPGDVVVGISTSGNSENVYRALEAAREGGCSTVGLLGRDGGRIAPLVDIALTVPSSYTPYIQEAHVTIIHLVCDLVEQGLFARPQRGDEVS
ncbi:D-sedoheptulose 7-phosphate isomerase [Trichloromonas sp.]|uniref:D-sedoheptulose 7-phosphate isomerase n=1 Tax=Trichloromonas sp. TaxID=3069249 RepID=UPI003D818D94